MLLSLVFEYRVEDGAVTTSGFCAGGSVPKSVFCGYKDGIGSLVFVLTGGIDDGGVITVGGGVKVPTVCSKPGEPPPVPTVNGAVVVVQPERRLSTAGSNNLFFISEFLKKKN
jgi:hypothetical protein